MNIYDFKTKADLDMWATASLVVYDVSVSPDTGNNRAVALMQFNANFDQKEIVLNVGVFELDTQGNPKIGKSLIPYYDYIIASNAYEVDIETMIITPIEDQDPNKTYMGEYDAYIYLTKNNSILIWDLFNSSIKNSSKFKQ
jgi:hypothetical protein